MPHKIPFRVVHVSGQDDNHKAVELNSHSPGTQGWQSARFCLYPQDVIIQLERRSQLKKIQILSHQHLIATKIEFFIGDCTEGIAASMMNATYRRLGYVALSDNEKTNYRARELKSVHVDAVGVFLKLLIHKNYVNKHNLYNQVGIIAVNVIGDALIGPYEMSRLNDEEYESHLATNDKAFYISPMEDLAFDLYQDPQVADIIRKLEKKKQKAVAEEQFEFARILRDSVNNLQLVGEKLGRMEIEKKQAIETEDFERAHIKKQQIEDYRMQAYREIQIDRLLMDGYNLPREPDVYHEEPRVVRKSPVPRETKLTSPSPPLHPPPPSSFEPIIVKKVDRNDNEERPLPALQSNNNHMASSTDHHHPLPLRTNRSSAAAAANNNKTQRPIPFVTEKTSSELTDNAAEEMSEADRRQAAFVIEVFGPNLVNRAYSKIWSHRENALLDVYNRLRDLPIDMPVEDKRAEMRAAVFLLQRGLKDKVFAVFRAALNLNKLLLVEFAERHDIPRGDVHTAVDKITAILLSRTGDTAIRLRELAKSYLVEMSDWASVRNLPSFYHECLKLLAVNAMDRYALSRVEVVTDLYTQHGLGHKDFQLDSVMAFCAHTLQHKSQEVREAAELLIVELYRTNDRNVIRSFLPPNDVAARKNPLLRRIFEKFDLLDGQQNPVFAPTPREPAAVQKVNASPKRASAVAAAAPTTSRQPKPTPSVAPNAPPPQPSSSQQQQQPVNQAAAAGQNQKKTIKNNNNTRAVAATVLDAPGDDDNVLFQDHSCIFCGEESAEFSKQGLDTHYWKSCPVLSRCPHCSMVVEVCNLTGHLLNECPQKSLYKGCPRCKEAIPTQQYDAHVSAKKCNPVLANDPDGDTHCPLCHENIDVSRHNDSPDDAWRAHLMGVNGDSGCTKNPRRLAKAFQQERNMMQPPQPPPPAAAPETKGAKGMSQLPKPVNRRGAPVRK